MQKTQKEKLSRAERQLRPIRIPMPLRYVINLVLICTVNFISRKISEVSLW